MAHLNLTVTVVCMTMCVMAQTMDGPPPPYSSFDETKGPGYPPPPHFYPPGPPPSNQYGATSYPSYSAEAAGYHGGPHSAPTAATATSFYPSSTDPQPQIIIAPAGFTRFSGGVQSIRQRYSTYGTHILLSCFVICCCGPGGFMCGLLAFCVAST